MSTNFPHQFGSLPSNLWIPDNQTCIIRRYKKSLPTVNHGRSLSCSLSSRYQRSAREAGIFHRCNAIRDVYLWEVFGSISPPEHSRLSAVLISSSTQHLQCSRCAVCRKLHNHKIFMRRIFCISLNPPLVTESSALWSTGDLCALGYSTLYTRDWNWEPILFQNLHESVPLNRWHAFITFHILFSFLL